jgi:PhoH-like ATPase
VDNQILSVVIHLQKKLPKRPVILVSKDINMRIKSAR